MAIDNRELTFTITADSARELITALDHSLTSHVFEKAAYRRVEELRSYLNIRLEALPELPKQERLKL